MIKKVFLIHHTHFDVGYTDQPLEVKDQQLHFLDKAVELCEKDPRFRWTVETAWIVRDYCRCRPTKQVQRLMALLRTGKIELSGMESQVLSEMPTVQELSEYAAYAASLGRKEHFVVQHAMLDDIAGYASKLPSALNRNGIRYFTCGSGGFQVFLPWAALPHLFYLEDSDQGRLLMWNLGVDRTTPPNEESGLPAVYGMGAMYIVLPYLRYFGQERDRAVAAEEKPDNDGQAEAPDARWKEFIARLEREHYPYEEVMLQYGGDNRWPSDFLPELLEKIRLDGRLPEIELTTPSNFFQFMEEKYNQTFPVLTGLITDPWITRITPNPEGLAAYLSAQRKRQYLQNLGADVPEVLKNDLLFYADHTCGLSEWHAPELRDPQIGPHDPVFNNLRQSWQTKKMYAFEAEKHANEALREALNLKSMAPLSLANMANRQQSGVVTFRMGRDLPELLALHDANGKGMRFQKLEHQFYLAETPALAAGEVMTLKPTLGEIPEYFVKQPTLLQPLPDEVTTDYYKAVIDRKTGRISRLESPDGACCYCDSTLFRVCGIRAEDFIPEWALAGMRPVTTRTERDGNVDKCGVFCSGEVATILEESGTIPGLLQYRLRTTLYQHMPFADAELFLYKPESRERQSVYFACALAGNVESWKIAAHGRTYDPDKDLLPGAMRDEFYAPCGAELRTRNFTAMMQSLDAPVLHPSSPELFSWHKERHFTGGKASYFWHLYHNFLITDCPAWQEVRQSFRFRLFLPSPQDIYPPMDSIRIF